LTVRLPPTVKLPVVATVSEVALPRVTLPSTENVPPTEALPVTVNASPIVTSSGRATATVTVVPDLDAVVTISFAVPVIVKLSVSKSTLPDPLLPLTVKAVATFSTPAASN